jgi:hypothetical protein
MHRIRFVRAEWLHRTIDEAAVELVARDRDRVFNPRRTREYGENMKREERDVVPVRTLCRDRRMRPLTHLNLCALRGPRTPRRPLCDPRPHTARCRRTPLTPCPPHSSIR